MIEVIFQSIKSPYFHYSQRNTTSGIRAEWEDPYNQNGGEFQFKIGYDFLF